MRTNKEKIPEERTIGERVVEELYPEKKESLERKELLNEEEKAIREKLEREIRMMELEPGLKEQAKSKAKEIAKLNEKGKLKHLLDLAAAQGVSFAVKVAQNTKDPRILDLFHDVLSRNRLYERFKK